MTLYNNYMINLISHKAVESLNLCKYVNRRGIQQPEGSK